MPEEELLNRILFEDNHLIIINKKAGEIVQGDKSGDEPLLEKVRNYIKVRYTKPGNVFCGLVHRIDRPVSGIVIFAKTSKALARMNEMIREHKLTKTYWAIVEGCPDEPTATLTHYLKKNEKQNKSYPCAENDKNGQKAILSFTVIGKSDHYALLEVDLFTGRHHQIRAQLASIQHPIKGDLKYGAKRSNEDGSISLHARKAVFEHPVSHQPITILADPYNSLFLKLKK